MTCARDISGEQRAIRAIALEFEMDRFFSKLDLRDIKIDPERTRFSPDEESEQDEVIADANQPETTYEVVDPAPAASFDDVSNVQTERDSNRDDSSAAWSPNGDFAENESDELGDVLKVSSKSRPSAVAGAIAGVVRELGRAEVQAIGAGATNQAIKAVAIARGYLQETGIDAVCLPEFINITIENEERTAVKLIIEPR
jgi:stage V sporulation protein S